MGLAPITRFVVLPLTHVMVIVFDLLGIAGAAGVLAFGAGFVAAGALALGLWVGAGVVVGVAAGVVAGTTVFSCESLIRMVGCEKWKLYAPRWSQPSFSLNASVCTS